MPIPSFKLKMLSNGKLLMVDGKLSTNLNCCCGDVCPCCYYALTINRGAGSTFAVRVPTTGFCTISADTIANPFHCGVETFGLTLDTISPPEGCVCYGEYNSDTNEYTADPCLQQYYTESALDQICNYNPPGPGTGVEIHYGTMSFREVITITACYDPCGTATVSINHKVYCQFGVRIDDTPPPLAGPPTITWQLISTDLVAESTWTWTDVDCPNCESIADLGAPTSETLASAYTKTWGYAFANCGGSSSFTVTIPAACSATSLELLGSGVPCECA